MKAGLRRAADANDRSAVTGNQRLTALASAMLLVLLVAEIATVPSLRTLISEHIFIGVLLAVPLAVKLGSVGYRFVRYYAGSPAFVREGPPSTGLRILAPLLVATTLMLVGSGLALLAVAPAQAGPLRIIHIFSFLVWLPMVAIHLFAHIRQVPRLIAEDWRERLAGLAPGSALRLGVVLGALALGVIAAFVVFPVAAPWITVSESGPGPFVVGMVAAGLAVLVTGLFKRK